MPARTFDPKNARLIVTSGGHIAVESETMGASEQAALFGPDGVLLPQFLASLIDDLLEMILTAPDSSDAERLRSLANDLKASQAKLETALAKLGV